MTSTLPKSRIIFILAGLVLLLAVPLTVFVAQQQQKTKQHASFTNPASNFSSLTKDYQQLIAEKAIDPAREMLEVSLSYDESKDPQVSVSETRILNGYVPSQFENLSPNAYTLQELDNYSRVLYKIRFEIPNDIHVDPNPDGTITAPVHTELKQVDFIQTIPYYSKANSIIIHDPQGRTIAVKFLKDTPKIDNQPNFRLINGEDIVQIQKTNNNNPGMGVPKLNMNNLLPSIEKAFAQEASRKVNIALIGDLYTAIGDTGKFNSDVESVARYFFEIEPYKTRASQINIVTLDNTENNASSLKCEKDTDGILICDNKKAKSLLNKKGVPHDVFVIIANGLNARANASLFSEDARISNADRLIYAFVHELGHSLAKLYDEYDYGNTSAYNAIFLRLSNSLGIGKRENCVRSKEQAIAEWKNLAGREDINRACTLDDWYRPSDNSIMFNAQEGSYFNVVSQKIINKKIDQIAGPYTEDKTPPQVKFESLDSEDQTLKIKALATDNKGVAYVQLWVDDVFLKTAYIVPYEFKWDTSSLRENETHTLYLKAYDVSGNVGQAERIINEAIKIMSSPHFLKTSFYDFFKNCFA